MLASPGGVAAERMAEGPAESAYGGAEGRAPQGCAEPRRAAAPALAVACVPCTGARVGAPVHAPATLRGVAWGFPRGRGGRRACSLGSPGAGHPWRSLRIPRGSLLTYKDIFIWLWCASPRECHGPPVPANVRQCSQGHGRADAAAYFGAACLWGAQRQGPDPRFGPEPAAHQSPPEAPVRGGLG